MEGPIPESDSEAIVVLDRRRVLKVEFWWDDKDEISRAVDAMIAWHNENDLGPSI